MRNTLTPSTIWRAMAAAFILAFSTTVHGDTLAAGVAKTDITDYDAGPVNDPLFVKTLIIKNHTTAVVIVTVDAVAIGEIGRIGNDFLPQVRGAIESEFGIPPQHIIVNASHCHGIVRTDLADLTLAALREAAAHLEPVRVAAGIGHEDRVQENRRIRMKDGSEIDSRHAYAMPPNADVAGIGPIDPEIGVLRLDRLNGDTLAAVYNFAMHPIQGVPSHANTADVTGFASTVIEANLGGVALFLQGCAGDINPVRYKDVNNPRDAEPLGNQLGLSALDALRPLTPVDETRLAIVTETIRLPRADNAARIAAMEQERLRLLDSLQGTSLSFDTFLPLFIKQRVAPDYPSYYANRYMHEEALGRDDLKKLDHENRANLDAYIQNVHVMERLTRLQTNLALLRKHYADNTAAGERNVAVEIAALRIADFCLITFPGELTTQIGLNIKQASPEDLTFVAGYTNGYIYYAPTAEQLRNVGNAQEDSDCILAPEWQAIFETKAADMMEKLK